MQEEDVIKPFDGKCHPYTMEDVLVMMMRLSPHCSEKVGDYIEVICCMHKCKGPGWHKPILVCLYIGMQALSSP